MAPEHSPGEASVTTAREQAREAARTENDRLGSEQMQASAEHYANVASDVWEPLLRAAYDLLYETYLIIDANPDEAKPGTVYAKIKEALG